MKCSGLIALDILFVFSTCFVHVSTTGSLEAVVNMGGVKGTVTFEATNPTSITGTLEAASTVSIDLVIKELPMVYQGGPSSSCSSLGDVVYDLQSTVGTVSSSTKFNKTDNRIKVSGSDSVFGRSLVLYNNSDSSVLACAIISIPLPSAAELFSKSKYADAVPITTAVATFRELPIAGKVTLRQINGENDLWILADMFYVNTETNVTSHKWKIVSDCSGSGNTVFSSAEEVVIGPATLGPSTNRSLVIVNSPMVKISDTIGKKVLILKSNSNDVLACATIEKMESLMGYTKIDKDNVKADFEYFQSSPWEPTYVKLALTGLSSRAKDYHVHDYPVLPSQGDSGGLITQCSGTVVSGHWNPYSVNKDLSPASTTGTYDEYEVGDLSGKHGNFTSLDEVDQSYVDYNLPLFGRNSILHRSIVIHKNDNSGSRFVCNTIHQKTSGSDVYNIEAKAEFTGDVQGTVTFTSVGPYNTPESTTTAVHLKLSYEDVAKKSNGHQWHVHQNAVANDECVNSVQGHYNPYNVDVAAQGTYAAACGAENMLRCEVGDLSSKSKVCAIGVDTQQMYTDVELPLMGPQTILGRSIVVHDSKGASGRLGCATITPVGPQKKTLNFLLKANDFDKAVFVSALAKKLSIDEWRIIMVTHSDRVVEDDELRCRDVSFVIIESTTSNVAAQVDKLNKEDDAKVSDDYQIDLKCHGAMILPTVVLLVLAQLISFLYL